VFFSLAQGAMKITTMDDWGKAREIVAECRPLISNIKNYELCCSGCEPAKDRELLRELGIEHVVRLGDEDDIAEYVTHDDITYVTVLLDDSTTAEMPVWWLDQMTQYIFNCDGCVLVHCYMGMSRSVSLCIAYLMRYHNMRFEQALQHMLKCRPCSSPNSKFRLDLALYDVELCRRRGACQNGPQGLP
jgi:hypothetical protein